MYTQIDKDGNAVTVNKLKDINKGLYKKLVLSVGFNGGTIAPYYDIMYNDYYNIIRGLDK